MKGTLFYKEFYKRNLPHYQPQNGIFFITTRLAFSLPEKVKIKLRMEKEYYSKTILKLKTKKEVLQFQREFHKYYFDYFDSFLDKYESTINWLSNPEIATIIKDNLHYWDSKRYILFAYCIMSNHIHIVLKPLEIEANQYESLSKIMFGLKSYTANKCNKILNRKGQFWTAESYDHYIRDYNELAKTIDYTINNPVQVDLVNNWKDWGVGRSLFC